MRLFEYDTLGVPDLMQFVTPQLIDEIIDQNRWVHHGADLEDWLDTSCYASDHAHVGELMSPEEAEELEQMPHEEARSHPNFRKCIEHWVEKRTREVQNMFMTGDKFDGIPPFGPDTVLTRLIRAETPKSSLGVYWTEHRPGMIVRVVPHEGPQSVIILQARAKDVQVDWYETLRSRLDYSNGCDEAEIQLVKGSRVTNIRVGLIDYRTNGRNDFFDEKKIVWKDEPFNGTA